MGTITNWLSFNDLVKQDVICRLVDKAKRVLGPNTDDKLIIKVLGRNMNFEPTFMSMLENELRLRKDG